MFKNFDLLKTRSEISIADVQVISNFLQIHEINAIKENSENFQFENSEILGLPTHPIVQTPRISSIKWLELQESNSWLYSKLTEKAEILNNNFWEFDLFGINEFIQFTEYNGDTSNRGHYDWHIDVGDIGITSCRKLSFECIMDDNHEGGETSFLLGPSENKIKLNKGDAVFYPSFLLNKVYTVTKGKRTSIVGWLNGPTFR